MYKEIIICIVVVIVIICLNWSLQNYTKYCVTNISDELYSIKNNLKEENKDTANEKMKNLHKTWDKNYEALAIFIEHDELEKVETNFVSLESYIEVSDYNMGINEIEKAIFVLKHIADKYDFSLVNVF